MYTNNPNTTYIACLEINPSTSLASISINCKSENIWTVGQIKHAHSIQRSNKDYIHEIYKQHC